MSRSSASSDVRAGPLGAGVVAAAGTGAAAASSVVVPHGAGGGGTSALAAAVGADRQIRPKPRLTRQSAIHDELLDPPGSPSRLTVRSVSWSHCPIWDLQRVERRLDGKLGQKM